MNNKTLANVLLGLAALSAPTPEVRVGVQRKESVKKIPLTKKQKKWRAKNKQQRKSRKINRK
jgi:hypothetical protein